MRGSSRWWAGGLVAAGVLTGAGTARGDACSDCPPPSMETLQNDAGMKLEGRPSIFGERMDYYETDGGECRVSLSGTPITRKRSEWVEAMMKGEAFNCPQGKMTSTVKLQLLHDERYEWHLEGSSSLEIGAPLLATLKSRVGTGSGGGGGSGVVAEIDQTIEAAYCHRLPWIAYFIVGDFGVTCPFSLERRYSWWTKNATTGATVHQSGEIWVPCKSGDGAMGRWAPLLAEVSIDDHACDGCTLPVMGRMGWFPPLPEPLKPPEPKKPTGSGDDDDPPSGTPAQPPNQPPPSRPPEGKDPSPVDPTKPPEPPVPPVPPAPPPTPPQDPPQDPPAPDGEGDSDSGDAAGSGGPATFADEASVAAPGFALARSSIAVRWLPCA